MILGTIRFSIGVVRLDKYLDVLGFVVSSIENFQV